MKTETVDQSLVMDVIIHTLSGLVYLDLATLLIDPETRFVQISSSNSALSTHKLEQLRQVVLSNYCAGEVQNPIAVNLCCARALLHKWAIDEGKVMAWRMQSRLRLGVLALICRHYWQLVTSYISRAAVFVLGLLSLDDFIDFWMNQTVVSR